MACLLSDAMFPGLKGHLSPENARIKMTKQLSVIHVRRGRLCGCIKTSRGTCSAAQSRTWSRMCAHTSVETSPLKTSNTGPPWCATLPPLKASTSGAQNNCITARSINIPLVEFVRHCASAACFLVVAWRCEGCTSTPATLWTCRV